MRNRWIGVAVSAVVGAIGTGILADEAATPAAPAPRPVAPVNRGGGAAPVAPRPGNAGGSAPAPQPPAPPPPPPVTPPGGVPPGTRDANGQPVDAAKANHEAEQRAKDGRHRHRFPRFRIPPTQVYGWAPYTWWSGTSYWEPPMDGYGDGSYAKNGGGEGADDYPPPDTSTPTQDQAKALNELEANPDYRAVVAELKQAESAYAAASARVIARLKKEDKDYQALGKERDEAKEEVEAAQASAKIPKAESVTSAAQKKLDAKSEVTRMEREAIAVDPQARAAKAKVAELGARVAAMRQAARGAGER